MKKKLFLFFTVLNTCLSGLYAQSGIGNLEFIENKGQWDNTIRFRANMPNTTFYLQKHGFSVLMQSPSDMEALRNTMHGIPAGNKATSQSQTTATTNKSGAVADLAASLPPVQSNPGGAPSNPNSSSVNLTMHSHVYQVEFMNSSEQVEIQGDKSLDTYNNYFIGNDPSRWKSNCKIYQAIIYKNIYPNIDLRYYTENNQLKYDLVVHPGGNPDNIVMKYRGADKLIVKSGQITIHTSVGDIKEIIPHTYQFSKDGNKDVECSYKAGPDNTVIFHVSNYSPAATLIIDPTLIFSTFTGSHSDNWGYTATYDESGSFYSGSITLDSDPISNGNLFPVSPGAYQSTFKGGDATDGSYHYDITIMKFSSNGVNRVYATYLGGKGNEQPHSLVVDQSGNLVVAGRTSSPDFPNVNSTGAKDILKGGYDIILTKLNAD
ncbi:MAG TPA: SBBP repeat-containing protein, partial [Puia sp.]|nr:SBBP repeat-containing protein [Puia sp.]